MFHDTLALILKGRQFTIESVPVRVEEGESQKFAPRVWEDNVLLNTADMPRFLVSEDAVQYGFDLAKKYVKGG